MKRYFLLMLVCIVCILNSCEKDEVFGDTLVYMPQATHNIGTDNNLIVDLNPSANADTSIVLGVYRSGLQELQGFSVDLMLNTDTIPKAKAIALQPNAPAKYNIYKTGILLPPNYYAPLPPKITVPEGERDAYIFLVLKKSLIRSNYPSGTILLLPVQIANPTKYKLNNDYTLTMVVMTVN